MKWLDNASQPGHKNEDADPSLQDQGHFDITKDLKILCPKDMPVTSSNLLLFQHNGLT